MAWRSRLSPLLFCLVQGGAGRWDGVSRNALWSPEDHEIRRSGGQGGEVRLCLCFGSLICWLILQPCCSERPVTVLSVQCHWELSFSTFCPRLTSKTLPKYFCQISGQIKQLHVFATQELNRFVFMWNSNSFLETYSLLLLLTGCLFCPPVPLSTKVQVKQQTKWKLVQP